MNKKNLIQWLLFIFLTLFITGFYIPFRIAINQRLENYKENYLGKIEEKYQVLFKYRSLSPTIINSIKVNDFSLVTKSEEISLKTEKISLFYGLKLFTRKNHFVLHRIIIKNGEIKYRIPEEENSNEVNLNDIINELTKLITSYFPEGSIELRNIIVHVMAKDNSIRWEIDKLSLNSDVDSVKFQHKGNLSINNELFTGLQIKGSSLLDFTSINGLIDFHSLSSPYLNIKDLSLSFLRSPDEGWLLRKVKDKIPLDFSVRYLQEQFSFIYQSERFIPLSLFTAGPEQEKLTPWLNSEISGTLSVSSSLDLSRMNYETDLFIKAQKEWIKSQDKGELLLDVNLKGTREYMDINQLLINTPVGNLSYQGSLGFIPRKIDGIFQIENLELPSQSLLSSRIMVKSQSDTLEFTTEGTNINNQPIGEILGMGEIMWEDRKVLANLVYEGPLAENLGMDLYADFNKELSFVSWYDINSLSLADLIGFYDPDLLNPVLDRAVSESLLTMKGSFGFDKSINFNIDSCLVENPRYRLAFNGYGKEEQFFLSDISLDMGDNNLEGSLKIDRQQDLSALLRFSLNEQYYDIDLNWNQKEKELAFIGSYGLKGSYSYLDKRFSYFSLNTKNLPITWQENELKVNISLSGSLKDNDLLISFEENSLIIDSSPLINPGKMIFSGLMQQGTLQLYRLDWIDDYSHVSGTGMINIPTGSTGLLSGWVTSISPKDEKYKLVFSQRKGNLSLFLTLENFILDRLSIENLQGQLNTTVKGDNLLVDPSLSGNFDLAMTPKGSLEGFFNYDKSNLTLVGLMGKWDNSSLDNGIISINLDKGEVNLSAGISGLLSKEKWKTGLVASFQLDNINQPLDSNITGSIKLNEIIHSESVLTPGLTFHLLRKNRNYYFYNSDRDVLNLIYNEESGSITALSQKLLPLGFHLRGYINKEKLDLQFTDLAIDLTKLNRFMPLDSVSPSKIIEFVKGDLSGNLLVSGTPQEPVINGQIDISPLQLDTAYSVKEKSSTSLEININDSIINVPYFEFDIGTTGSIGAKAEVTLRGFDIEEYDFDFFLKGRNGGSVPIIYLIKGLALNGEAQGDVTFYGAGGQHFINGNILINKMILSLVQNVPRVAKSRSLDPMDLKVDLIFTTGKDVSMVIPNEDFHFVKASLDIDQKLRFNLDNIPRFFSLTGDFSIRQGDIAYFDKNFYLTQGRVLFDENQEEFNPLLDLKAETVVTNKGEKVTLMINYKGSLFSDFDPQFSSMPSFTEREILSMMEPYQGDDSTSLALALGAYVDKYTFSAPFEEGIKKALDVDLVTIETGLLKNILEDQLNNGQGVYSNSTSQYNVARYLDGTFLNVGKYISKDLFVSGGINLDYNTNQTFMGGMGFNFNLTFEMETPFFNIGWTYLPDDFTNINSSEGFISDTGITINFRL